MIEICAVGGYNEVGKNCTAINIDGEVVICDMGVHLEPYIKFTEDEDILKLDPDDLIKVGAVPNISKIKDWKDKVKAIVPTHAHLDHVGAIPFLAYNFKADILCTPFTASVINAILRDEKIKIPNKVKSMSPNSVYQLTDNIKLEFINMTHSCPQTAMIAIHTKYGVIFYANDFKFDSTPTLGQKPNFKRLREIAEKNRVLALIVDSTYAGLSAKTPSEAVAKEILKEVLLGTESKDKAVVITTFSSHLARLKSIIEFGKRMDRKILFLGRSLSKYVNAGEDIGIVDFSKDAKIIKFSRQVKAKLAEVNSKRGKYLLVVTGHQGERKAILSRMVRNETPFRFKPGDQVIFSCKVIPTKTNIDNRDDLENAIRSMGVRIFRDVHVSGHAAREDLRDLIDILNPEFLIPAHGENSMKNSFAELAEEIGYKKDKVLLLNDGQKHMF